MIAAMPLRGLRAHNMLRWGLFGALGMGLLSLSAGSGTLAYFTTQVQSNNNTFTAGNLRFNIADSISTTGQYPSVGSSLSLLNMKPGDAVYAPIKLTNVGNIDSTFGISYTTSSVLASNSDINGGTVSQVAGNIVDSGRSNGATGNGLSFAAAAYGGANGLDNKFVVITAGTAGAGVGEFHQISSVTAPDTLVMSAPFTTATFDGALRYNVVNYAGTPLGASSGTVLSDTNASWTPNQWTGYSVTAAVGGTQKIVSNTATSLTVVSFAGGNPPSGTYTISPTNLAGTLNLGILGKGASGTGTAGTGAAGTDCNAASYLAPGAIWLETAVTNGSPAKALGLLVPGGTTVLTLPGTGAGTPILAGGNDILCMQVSWTDHNAPLSLTTEDNAFNGANHGAYSTNINFIFDGQ
jgi:predicted ribosomally synthesized peptide with SipW-like signal peptide